MCQNKNHLLLCTCSTELKMVDADWILFRKKEVAIDEFHFGETKLPYQKGFFKNEMDDNKIRIEFYTTLLEQDLNNHNCFDFNYKPKASDELHIWLMIPNHLNSKTLLKFIYADRWMPWKSHEKRNDIFDYGRFGKPNETK